MAVKQQKQKWTRNNKNLTNLISFHELCYLKNLSKRFGKMSLGKRNEKFCRNIYTAFISDVLKNFIKKCVDDEV